MEIRTPVTGVKDRAKSLIPPFYWGFKPIQHY